MLCVGMSACDVYDGRLIADRSDSGDYEQSGMSAARPLKLGPDVFACNEARADADADDDGETAALSCQLSHATSLCIRGSCVLARCDHGYLDCDQNTDNGCEAAPDDAEHCGSCDQRCALEHASARCLDGECRVKSCDDGFADCDEDGSSCESDLSQPDNCGGCFVQCAARCVDGQCEEVDTDCSDFPGHADCDRDHVSCETDISTDVDHCGSCQNVCRFTSNTPHAMLGCRSERCQAVCDAGFGDCDGDYRNGCEQPLSTPQHCGKCEVSCEYAHAASACVGGKCQRSTCEDNYADCDGDGKSCEQSLVNRETCGSCGTLCRLPHALGACSRAQSDGAIRCEVDSCNTGWGNCDGISGNGCERDTRSPANGGQGPCVPALGCVPYLYQAHTYYVCPLPMRWADARTLCQTQLRGDLATLGRAEVAAILEARVATRVWVGHNAQRAPGLWSWARNNVPFWQGGVSGVKIRDRYVNWESGEPSGSGQCGSMLNTGTIADENCSDVKAFICEVGPDDCPNDPNKIDPGQCGCGSADTDATGDGIAECLR